MQFVRHGPDIPEGLLQAHEDGRVVFFCGAGISYPARLPGFKGLVQRLFPAVGEVPNEVASMIAYVCSERASATTGAALRVDGGVVRAIA